MQMTLKAALTTWARILIIALGVTARTHIMVERVSDLCVQEVQASNRFLNHLIKHVHWAQPVEAKKTAAV